MLSRFSMSSLSFAEAALSLCDLSRLSSLNLAHVSGTETLNTKKNITPQIDRQQYGDLRHNLEYIDKNLLNFLYSTLSGSSSI